ncbi:MAG: hypothetical protein GWN18_02730, partial [Thermoplasmata archaeon]|nr:hypothetical protein [Thermoplasmata archaeon]NIS10932.1 hypothetical protein [Thermoplasmata archaeon]NIS18860.1 hypothetical protein [Thermoplasmata archaeon]NIT75891.1 hypothetical protein [Thermoplasmata archaeon]NIU48015.1 hypothetical protein [Thermoplasmata archaeon]
CTVSDCDGDGIWLDVNEHIDMPMAGGSIEDCTLVGCGIYIEGMTGSTVEGNSIDGAVDGIFLNATQLPIKDNVFRENLIVDCTGWGLRFNMTNGTNRFFLNTLTGNTRHSTAAIDGDVFDDGSTYGNYWGDYEERYPDATAVGRVWDTPYAVGEGTVTDMFPLAYAYDTIDPVADAGEQQGGAGTRAPPTFSTALALGTTASSSGTPGPSPTPTPPWSWRARPPSSRSCSSALTR